MDKIINQKISANKQDWIDFFQNLPVKKIKMVKYFGEKIWIDKPTGFILIGKNHYVLGYTTQSNVLFDTHVFKQDSIKPYTSTKFFINKRDFHSALFYRINLLDTLNINISDIKWFEISRRCLFIVFMELDMDLLYKRELKLLKKMKMYNKELYQTLTSEDFLKKMHDLYHNYITKEIDINYSQKVQSLTYKWYMDT